MFGKGGGGFLPSATESMLVFFSMEMCQRSLGFFYTQGAVCVLAQSLGA